MTRKHTLILLCAALAGVLAALALSACDPQALPGLLTGPGQSLRELSLSGPWGNLGAWAVTLAITLLPLVLLVLPKGRGSLAWEDWLLLPACGVGFCMVFFSVNPTLLPMQLPEIWPYVSLCVYLSLLAAWLVLRVLRRLENQGRTGWPGHCVFCCGPALCWQPLERPWAGLAVSASRPPRPCPVSPARSCSGCPAV